jgi:hypothetical protein
MHRTFGVWRFDFFVSHFYLAADFADERGSDPRSSAKICGLF